MNSLGGNDNFKRIEEFDLPPTYEWDRNAKVERINAWFSKMFHYIYYWLRVTIFWQNLISSSVRLEKINLTSNIRLFLRVFISRRKMSKYFDIGANLTDPVFNGIYRGKEKHPDDFEAIMSRAKEIGMKGYLVTGGTLEGNFKKLDFPVQFLFIIRRFKIWSYFLRLKSRP